MPEKPHLSPALIGGVLSIGSLPMHLILSHLHSVQLAAMLLAVIGAIYVGFALQRGSTPQIVVEIMVASGFMAVALLGLWVNQWAIPIGYVLHGAWDFAHHRHKRLVTIPSWYPSFCAIYDWVFAIGLMVIWLRQS